ncbi:hypothetical protein CPB85DRAFT_285168 [Mucidula mucida]|nr:hypothetical protein CPB85DRAFT_285168 [Mucidula mucida]
MGSLLRTLKSLSLPSACYSYLNVGNAPYGASRTGLCHLPCELQNIIFSKVDDPVDVFAFCLTASYFWRIGLPHFKALYIAHAGDCQDWRGDRLICMGDYATDCPEGLFTDAELEMMKEEFCYDYDYDASRMRHIVIYPSRSISDVRWPTYEFYKRCTLKDWNPWARPPRPVLKNPRLAAAIAKFRPVDDEPSNDLPEWLPRYKYDFSAWRDMELPQASSSDDPKKPRALRNLSKKVFVRESALALTRNGSSSVYHMSFGSLVLARIAWSTDPDMRMAYCESHDIHRGIWAGDRFDVVDIDAMEDGDGWTDVSAAARKELEEIWESEFEDDWQAVVRKQKL